MTRVLTENEFHDLLLRYTPYLRSQVRRYTPLDMEDAVQDVLVEACAKRLNFDPEKGAFVTWLYWIVRSTMQQRNFRLRKRAPVNRSMEFFEDGEPVYEAVSVEGDPHACLELSETLDAIKALKPRETHVVLNRALGLTFDEIGGLYNATASYAQQLHAHAMRRLRREMKRRSPRTVEAA